MISYLTCTIFSGIEENEIDESSNIQRVPRKKGAISKLFDNHQERAAQVEKTEGQNCSTMYQEQMEIDESTILGQKGAHEKSKLAKSSNVSANITVSAAISFPKLGKKADSLSVKELKTELGKRGQPIDGNKKGYAHHLTQNSS